MRKLTIGDWVTCETGGTNPYKIINENILKYCTNGSRKNVELWFPSKGDWCWFSRKGELPTIGQYKDTTSTGYFLMKKHQSKLWTSIEPFIGNLPSFIKGK